jgi:hypothetical protein
MPIKTEIIFEPFEDEWRVLIHEMFFIAFKDKEHAEAFYKMVQPMISQLATGVGEIGDIDGINFTDDN